jgi:uncharacterized damage-inducible protein DinB
MTKLEYVRRQTAHLLDRVLLVFDKALRMIPADQLGFRPTPVSMSARELGVHAYQAIYALTRAAATGSFRRADLATLPIDAERVESVEEIHAYGRQVKEYVRGAVAAMTEEDLMRQTKNEVGPPSAPGYASMSMAYEEALHHRGQLMLYLRMMGVPPPRPYDYR